MKPIDLIKYDLCKHLLRYDSNSIPLEGFKCNKYRENENKRVNEEWERIDKRGFFKSLTHAGDIIPEKNMAFCNEPCTIEDWYKCPFNKESDE